MHVGACAAAGVGLMWQVCTIQRLCGAAPEQAVEEMQRQRAQQEAQQRAARNPFFGAFAQAAQQARQQGRAPRGGGFGARGAAGSAADGGPIIDVEATTIDDD